MSRGARPRAVVFDLDGTLLDSLEGIGRAMNAALVAHGLPAHPLEAYRHFVGEGVNVLAERALPKGNEALKAAVIARYREAYEQLAVPHTRPYAGIPALLDQLTARGLPLAILSNKPHGPTCELVTELLGRWRFRAVYGEREGIPRKPDPTAAHAIAGELKAAPEECFFVGDTGVDMRTAVAAKMTPVGVLWGFRDQTELTGAGARHVIALPQELLDLLG